jgi:predicted nucleic acid-binding protein
VTLSYLDASALTKLVVRERGSAALVRWVRTRRLTSSAIARVEVHRAVKRLSRARMNPIDEVFATVDWVACNDAALARAAAVEPDTVRTLDAIHVATALEIGGELEAFVTYDDRQAEAAALARLPVVSPR